jgi:hypothetical protein
MSSLLDVTCGCEACGTRWETTAWEPEGPEPDWSPVEPCCPHCDADTYTVIISINNDVEGSHPSLTAGERSQ